MNDKLVSNPHTASLVWVLTSERHYILAQPILLDSQMSQKCKSFDSKSNNLHAEGVSWFQDKKRKSRSDEFQTPIFLHWHTHINQYCPNDGLSFPGCLPGGWQGQNNFNQGTNWLSPPPCSNPGQNASFNTVGAANQMVNNTFSATNDTSACPLPWGLPAFHSRLNPFRNTCEIPKVFLRNELETFKPLV
jgi:hypothetical protein